MDETEQMLLARFLDEDGRVKQFPAKAVPREAVLGYLADKFEWDAEYKEREVNAILTQWHSFNDYFILRRSLIESGHLKRYNDGSKYWRNPEKTGECSSDESV